MEAAVYADCRTLIESFAQNGNPRFESFSAQWKAHVFQHLYTAQSTAIELLQTTAAALHVAKRNACGRRADGSSHDDCSGGGDEQTQLLRRIGGIYLMYATYFKQPTAEYVKVTLSLETWQELRSFIDALPLIPATDEVRMVFWKLRHANAFRFAALDYCVGLEKLVDYDEIEEHSSMATATHEERLELAKAAGLRLKQELYELNATQELVPALTVLEDGYNEMKEMLVTAEGAAASGSVKNSGLNAQSLPPTTIFRDLKSTFNNIQQILDEPRRNRSLEEDKKLKIKRKRYIVTHTGNDNVKLDEDDGMRQMRRMSARTVFREQLPADMLRDLQNTESEDEIDDEVPAVGGESDEENENGDGSEIVPVKVSSNCLMEIEEILSDNWKPDK